MKLDIIWEGETVGTVTDVDVDMFHFSGRWTAGRCDASRKFIELLKEGRELIVTIGRSPPPLAGRVYAEPAEFIEITLSPDLNRP